MKGQWVHRERVCRVEVHILAKAVCVQHKAALHAGGRGRKQICGKFDAELVSVKHDGEAVVYLIEQRIDCSQASIGSTMRAPRRF